MTTVSNHPIQQFTNHPTKQPSLMCDPNKLAASMPYDPSEMAPAFPAETLQQHYSSAAPRPQRAANRVASVATGVANSDIKISVNSVSCDSVANVAAVATIDTKKNIYLRSDARDSEQFPVESFGPFAEAVKALASTVKVPMAMAGSSVLTTLAYCAQGIANVQMRDGRMIPTSLYCLTVGDSGDRKTALDNIVSQPIKSIEKELYAQYRLELQDFLRDKEAYEKKPKKEKELFPFEQEAPKNPAMVLENINAEGLFRSLKEGRPSIAIFSDEGGTLFGGDAFKKENALKSITFFSKLWDGSPVDKVRSGEGFSRLYDRRLSMHLMMQPTIAKQVLSNELLQGQGFLPRFLIAWPESLKGTRYYDEYNVRQDKNVQDLFKACDKILRTPLNIDEGTESILFERITMDDLSHTLWVHYHNSVESLLAPDGDLSLISANASKCAEQCARIAGVLTLAVNPQARRITGETMKNAIILSQWYLKESLRLRQNGEASPEILRAEALLNWLRKKKLYTFTARFIQQNGPRPLRLKGMTEEALYILKDHKYVRRGVGSATINGISTQNFWELV